MDRGVYRRIPVKISGSSDVLTDPLRVPEEMEKLVLEFSREKGLHPIEKASLFHLKFEGIHPFADGNGRRGRLIMNLILMKYGYPPVRVKYKDRKRHYQALEEFSIGRGISAMTEIPLEGIKERLEDFLAILE